MFLFTHDFSVSPFAGHHVMSNNYQLWAGECNACMCLCSVCSKSIAETSKDLVDLWNPCHNATILPGIVAEPHREHCEVAAGGQRSDAITIRASSLSSEENPVCTTQTRHPLCPAFSRRGEKNLMVMMLTVTMVKMIMMMMMCPGAAVFFEVIKRYNCGLVTGWLTVHI